MFRIFDIGPNVSQRTSIHTHTHTHTREKRLAVEIAGNGSPSVSRGRETHSFVGNLELLEDGHDLPRVRPIVRCPFGNRVSSVRPSAKCRATRVAMGDVDVGALTMDEDSLCCHDFCLLSTWSLGVDIFNFQVNSLVVDRKIARQSPKSRRKDHGEEKQARPPVYL